ncbi:MAG: ATP-binding cassette domain-containing protein [Candidatus Omnitrophica bacterium]|nr:ATP-binding cassette domain-containing protein [Candidatus Omnitrophota bacterium]
MMSVLLQVNNLRKRYGAFTIFDDATASFSDGQKIGVVGRNGAGKSTLCKILTGQEEMDSGDISRNAGLKLSYLEQHDPFGPDETVMGFLTRYTGKEPWACGEMAARFQLKHELLDARITSLAGGYQTRVKLTAMLLGDPNFLIMDEPSNYLDLSTLILLENFLQNFNGGFLIVSHDREFLKRTSDHTLEIENGRMVLYPGSIEEYFEFKEEQLQQKLAYNKGIQKKREQLQEFIDRFKAKAATATRAKSKMKLMEKLKSIEIEHTLDTVHILIPSVEKKAGIALACEDLSVGYPEKLVASRIHFDLERGMHVAVLGDNGQGKTTFLKTIAGQLPPKAGSFRWGTGLKVGYYAQHVLSMLHPQDDVYTHLQREAPPEVTRQDILNMAGCFLFKGDDVEKKVPVLSGGERARLCLAGLLLAKSHVLLLDEPTNHLDFETVEALGHALKKYEGTLFFISHDRSFVNMVANQILEVKDGSIRKYPGAYEDYVYHLEVEARGDMRAGLPEENTEESKSAGGRPEGKSHDMPAGEQSQANAKTAYKKIKAEITKLKVNIKKLELRIGNLTQERDDLLQEIRKNPFHYSRQRNDKLKQLIDILEEEEKNWLQLEAELERLKKEAAGEKDKS